MPKQSALPEDTNPATGDFVTGINTTPTASRFKLLNLIALFFNNIPSHIIGAAALVGIKLQGVGTPITGTAPSPGTGNFLMQSGSSITGTNGAGQGAISFPIAFPNGVLTVVICQGDTTAGNVAFAVLNSTDVNQIVFQCPALSTTLRVNWIAIGF